MMLRTRRACPPAFRRQMMEQVGARTDPAVSNWGVIASMIETRKLNAVDP